MDFLDFILVGPSRQRYALVKLFADHRNEKFTRQEILEEMTREESEYHELLTAGGKDDNPFHPGKDPRTIPTILRERLEELVKENFIIQEKTGKEVRYHTKENVLTNIFEDYTFNEEARKALRFWIASWGKYKELPYADLLELLDKRCREASRDGDDEDDITIVDFETPFNRDEKFNNNVRALYWSIHDRRKIKKITYEGHYYSGRKPEVITVNDFMPYVLKESRGQWYAVGKGRADKDFRAIPVNRITEMEKYPEGHEHQFTRDPFDPGQYWDGCAGITRYGSPLTITFKVRNGKIYNNIDYIRTLPIVKGHQKEEPEGEWMKVTLTKVFVGPELVRIIRSFGRENIRDVIPGWLEEDLWEEGRRTNIRLSIKFDQEHPDRWKEAAEKLLHIATGGENEGAGIEIKASPNKKGWHQVTLQDILVNSLLFYYMTKILQEYKDRIVLKDRTFLS